MNTGWNADGESGLQPASGKNSREVTFGMMRSGAVPEGEQGAGDPTGPAMLTRGS